MLKDKY